MNRDTDSDTDIETVSVAQAAPDTAAPDRGDNGAETRADIGLDPDEPTPVPLATVDLDRIAAAVREILEAIGEDPDRDGLRDTPARVARMYEEITLGLREEPHDHLSVTFEASHDEMVMVRDIPLYSICEHHLIPFLGKAHVAYIPNDDGRITGLSKLARLVDGYAKRPQVQERLTAQVADEIERTLEPRGVLVVVEAEHLCMSMRGVRKPGSSTVTSAVRGLFRDNPATRQEAMRFIPTFGS
jgi:GTP cyclohydrolase IA